MLTAFVSELGSRSAVLITDAARQVARPGIALATGMVVALYEMMVLFDALILMESLLLFLEALFLWLLSKTTPGTTRRTTLAAIGCALGLAAQCRATSALLLIPTLWFVLVSGGVDRTRAIRSAALVGAAFLVVSLPSTLCNAWTAHEFIPFTYNLGYNLYVGNNPRASGGFVAIAEGLNEAAVPAGQADGGAEADGREFLAKRRGLALSPGQSSSYWTAEAVRFVRQQPGRVAALLVKKTLLLVNRTEVSQIESAQMYRNLAGPLGLPFLGTFLLLGPLGILGAAFAHHSGSYGRFLRLCLLTTVCGILPFFVTDRYRVHLVPPLAILAALAAQQVTSWWKSRSWSALQRATLIWISAMVVVALPVRGSDAHVEDWTNWRDVGTRLAEHGDASGAVQAFERSLAVQRRWGFDRDPDPAIAQSRALLAFNYGVALHTLGRDAAALRWFDAAVRDDPTNARFVRTLADAQRAAGQESLADSLTRGLSTLVGGEPQGLILEGWQAMRQGRAADAESLFTRAVLADENQFGAWMALVRVQVERGELGAAKRTLDRASRLRVPEPVLWAHTALVAAASGDSAGARAALGRIPPGSIAGNRLVRGVIAEANALLNQASQ